MLIACKFFSTREAFVDQYCSIILQCPKGRFFNNVKKTALLIGCKFFFRQRKPSLTNIAISFYIVQRFFLAILKNSNVGRLRVFLNKTPTCWVSWRTREENNGRGWSGVESLLSEAQQACSLLRHLAKKKQLRCESDDQSPKVSSTTKIYHIKRTCSKNILIIKDYKSHLSPTFSGCAKPVVVLAHLGSDLSKFDLRLEMFHHTTLFVCKYIQQDLIKTFVMASWKESPPPECESCEQ